MTNKHKAFICVHSRSLFLFAVIYNLTKALDLLELHVLLKSDSSQSNRKLCQQFLQAGIITSIIPSETSQYTLKIGEKIGMQDEIIFWIEDDVLVERVFFEDAIHLISCGADIVGSQCETIDFNLLDKASAKNNKIFNRRISSPERLVGFRQMFLDNKINLPGRLIAFSSAAFSVTGIMPDYKLFDFQSDGKLTFKLSEIKHRHIGLLSDIFYENYDLERTAFMNSVDDNKLKFFFNLPFSKFFYVNLVRIRSTLKKLRPF